MLQAAKFICHACWQEGQGQQSCVPVWSEEEPSGALQSSVRASTHQPGSLLSLLCVCFTSTLQDRVVRDSDRSCTGSLVCAGLGEQVTDSTEVGKGANYTTHTKNSLLLLQSENKPKLSDSWFPCC